MEQVVGRIFKDTNYCRFRFRKGNRLVDLSRLAKLKSKIDGDYRFSDYPILVTPDGSGCLHIIDGQHRFLLCKELDLPIYYIYSSYPNTLSDIQRANTLNNHWRVADVIHSRISEGDPNYQLLYNDMQEVGLGHCALLYALGRRHATKQIMSRTLSYTKKDSTQAKAILSGVQILKSVDCLKDKLTVERVLSAYARLTRHPHFKQSVFEKQVKKYGNRVCRYFGDFPLQYQNFIKLYNFNRNSQLIEN